MPNSRLMFKQPQGGAQGSNVEVNITTTELSRNLMATIEWLIKYTGKGRTEIEELLDRDTFMSSVEAVAAGYLDGIIDGEAPMQEQVLAQKAAFYKKTRPLRYTEDDEELLCRRALSSGPSTSSRRPSPPPSPPRWPSRPSPPPSPTRREAGREETPGGAGSTDERRKEKPI